MNSGSTRLVLACCFLVWTSTAWVPHIKPRSSPSSNPLFFENQEKLLREEIAERNSEITDEEKYGIADGTGLERLATEEPPPHEKMIADRTSLAAKIERMIQPRAYPLFLMEKAAEIVESGISDLQKALQDRDLWFGEEDRPAPIPQNEKEKLVVLGTGWGGASFLKEIDTDIYDVTVISPRNHFVFTPMLAGASVGTVEYRSICEPIREINRRAKFLEATAQHVDPARCAISCESVMCEGNSCQIETFTVPYDRLIVSVGAQTNTFGIPGVKERCNFLKTVEDARRIKTAMINCFERASLPHLSDQERIDNLTFAVIGAGPTGIEFAAELRDFVEQDGPKYYPNLLRFVRIKVIEASPTILAPFDKSLQKEAIEQMQRTFMSSDPAIRDLLPERFALTELLLESSVKEVGEDTIFLNNGKEIPFGLAVWAAGNGPIPLTLSLIDELGEEQAAEQDVGRGRLAIDHWMRVIGSDGKILSFGDCSCITAGQLPATAQVASQQAEYLAKLLNKRYDFSPERSPEGVLPPPRKVPEQTKSSFSDAIAGFATTGGNVFAKPFQYLNLGILAYTGQGSALAQVTPAPDAPAVKGKGKLGYAVWRSVYLSKQVSWRNRLLVLNDWTNRKFFGRDITRL